MEYRQLGQTGYSVSRLGFGAMRLPMTGKGEDAQVNRELAIPLIHRAFEAGINYIDSARGYCNTDSQRAVGEAVENWHDRESIIISTKNPYFGKDEKKWWKNLEDSLRRLRVESIGEEEWEPGQKADKCIECGECEIKCPQNIPIINQLAEAHQMLSGKM